MRRVVPGAIICSYMNARLNPAHKYQMGQNLGTSMTVGLAGSDGIRDIGSASFLVLADRCSTVAWPVILATAAWLYSAVIELLEGFIAAGA